MRHAGRIKQKRASLTGTQNSRPRDKADKDVNDTLAYVAISFIPGEAERRTMDDLILLQ
jgi:hypothetical protein